MKPLVRALVLLGCAGVARAQVQVLQQDLDGDGVADLRIVGNGAAQRIRLVDSGAALLLTVDANGDGDTSDPGELQDEPVGSFESVFVEAGGGNDQVSYVLGGAFPGPFSQLVGVVRRIRIDLGAGNDQCDAFIGGDVLGKSDLSVDVIGGSGNDTVLVGARHVEASKLALRCDAGAGDDSVVLDLTQEMSGARIDARCDLGAGTNSLGFVQFATLTEGTCARVRIDGGAAKDVVGYEWIGRIENGASLEFVARGNAGDDILSVADSGGAGGAGGLFGDVDGAPPRARFELDGGEGDDDVRFGTGNVPHPLAVEGRLEVALAGGAGDDHVRVELNDGGELTSTAVFADASMAVELDGGAGDDAVTCALAATTFVGPYDLAIRGGAGDDLLTFSAAVPGTSALFPRPFVEVDGGLGVDVAATAAPVGFPLRLRNVEGP